MPERVAPPRGLPANRPPEQAPIVVTADDGRPDCAEHARNGQRAARSKEMAYTGQVIENPVSGERITFKRTAADTGGELLSIQLELSPGAAGRDRRAPRPQRALPAAASGPRLGDARLRTRPSRGACPT